MTCFPEAQQRACLDDPLLFVKCFSLWNISLLTFPLHFCYLLILKIMKLIWKHHCRLQYWLCC